MRQLLYTNARGARGVQGERGPKGDKGDRGEQGERGLQGEIGSVGPIGLTGEKGNKGDKGDKGDDGEAIIQQIYKGDTGPQGERGEKGLQGPKGERGKDGIDGIDGVDGKSGKAGKDGKSVHKKDIQKMVTEFGDKIIEVHNEEYNHKLIHDPYIIGSKEISERGIKDGMALVYDKKKNKLVYKNVGIKVTQTAPIYNNKKLATSSKTANYTATPEDDLILVDATSGAITITLYSAAGRIGNVITIKKVDSSSNIVTIATNGSETIDGQSDWALVNQYSLIKLVSDDTNFQIL